MWCPRLSWIIQLKSLIVAKDRNYYIEKYWETMKKNDKLCDIVIGQQTKYKALLDKHNALLKRQTAIVKVSPL